MKIKEYKIGLDLKSGAKLEMLMFSHDEHRWFFKNRYVERVEKKLHEEPDMINDTTLVVDYKDGIAQNCELTMDIVFPPRRRKVFLLGVDVSINSKLNVTFQYDKKEGFYKMAKVDLGRKVIDLEKMEQGLMKPVDFQFPVEDKIENKSGEYSFPFLKSDWKIDFFTFPDNYRRQV
jgi:hypothetical protein